MSVQLAARIDAMYGRDRLFAIFCVVALWICQAFVFFAVVGMASEMAMKLVLGGAVLLLLIFNTASITAMLSHYAEDREGVYGADIQHLDARRAAAGRPAAVLVEAD